MDQLRIKEGDGSVILTLNVNKNTTVNEIVKEVHEQRGIPIDKITLILSNDLQLELNKKLIHYNNPTDAYLATELWLSYFSDEHQKNYFFNPETKETV